MWLVVSAGSAHWVLVGLPSVVSAIEISCVDSQMTNRQTKSEFKRIAVDRFDIGIFYLNSTKTSCQFS